MPLADPSTFCTTLDPTTGMDAASGVSFDPATMGITLPGGVFISVVGLDPHRIDTLLTHLNTALAPFQPIFNLVDAVLLAKKVIDKLTAFDLGGAGKALPLFGKAVDRLASLVVQVSIPKTILNTIDVVILMLAVTRSRFEALANAGMLVDRALERAQELNSPQLLAIANCAQSQLDAQTSVLRGTVVPLNRLIGVLNLLCQIAGLPELPLADVEGDLAGVADKLGAVQRTLSSLRDRIPV